MDIRSKKCSDRLGYSTASGIAFDAFNTSGFDTTLQRGPDGLIIDHNTVTAPTWDPAHVHGTWMMWLRGSITGLSITSNVYDPNGAVMGTNNSAGLNLAGSTAGMTIGGNVWGKPGSLRWDGSYQYANGGWLAPAAWEALVPTDSFPTQLDAASIGTAGAGILAPKAPADLAATAGAGQIALAWDASTGADTYNLYRDDGSGYRLYQSGLSTGSFIDTAVTPDQA